MGATQRIKIANELNNNKSGYSILLMLNDLLDSTKNNVILDYSETSWISANMFSVLGAIIRRFESRSYSVNHENMNPGIKDLCKKNGFLEDTRPDVYKTTIKYQTFDVKENKKISEYISTEVIGKGDFPKMSKLLEKSIKISLEEIINNAYEHGDTETVFTCGQYFYHKKITTFTIVDLGKTIKSNVQSFISELLNEELVIPADNSIVWAAEDNHTTKKGDTPGGIGLGLIRKFLKVNKGNITIVSDEGYWTEKNEIIKHENLGIAFPGTIVTLEFNISDNSFYYFKEEKKYKEKE